MTESTTPTMTRQSTPHATLVALGLKVQQLDLFRPIREQVHSNQKTVRYTPTDKLYDAWIAILAGAQGSSKSTPACAAIRCCNAPSVARPVQNSR